MAGEKVSHFQIVKKIGVGGMGVVYQASDLLLDRLVALKFLPPWASRDEEALARLKLEAKMASSLDHPNICTIYEIAETPNSETFIAMAYYEGETLYGKIRRGGLPVATVVDFAVQIAEGLARAHAREILHRDIKPANLMVTNEGVVKILDFGLAWPLSSVPSVASSANAGTCLYMSPEQACSRRLDPRSDQWSWAVVLFEMLTGVRPFHGRTAASVVRAIVNHPPDLTGIAGKQIPDSIVTVISRSLSKNPDERYPDMMGAIAALRDSAIAYGPKTRRDYRQMAPRAIAVLPFRNLSPNLEDEYFSEGLAEELISAMTRVESLHVAPRASSFAYKGSQQAMAEIGAELRVPMLLEGSVRRSGKRLRVDVGLIDVVGDRSIWSDRYDREVEDVFAIQEDIAKSVVNALKIRLRDEGSTTLITRHTNNLQAYNLYLKGRYQWNRSTADALLRAVDAFEEAVVEDPEYALPLCGLADCYVVLGAQNVLLPRHAWQKARAAATRALELDPKLAEPHACLGAVLATDDFNWAGAEQEFLRAIELDEACAHAHHWYAMRVLSPTGRSDEAIREIRRALALEPLSLIFNSSAGWLYYLAGLYDQAVEQCRTTLELDPQHFPALWCLGSSYRELGLMTDAMATFEKMKNVSSDDPLALGLIGHFYAATERRADAEAVLAQLGERGKKQYVSPMYSAWIHGTLNEPERALEFLEAAYENRDFLLPHLQNSAGLRPIRQHPRFKAMVAKLGIDYRMSGLTMTMAPPVE